MPQYIIKLVDKKNSTDYYLIWSSVVNAPVTNGMSLESFKTYYREEYGNQGILELPERLSRVDKTGCSSILESLDDLISTNRAGKNEKKISKQEILDNYCINI